MEVLNSESIKKILNYLRIKISPLFDWWYNKHNYPPILSTCDDEDIIEESEGLIHLAQAYQFTSGFDSLVSILKK